MSFCEYQVDPLSSETKKDRSLCTTSQSTLSHASTMKQENHIVLRNQEEDSKFSTIFLLEDQHKTESSEEAEVQMSGNLFEEIAEDDESIEEFDPEDPAFQNNEEEEEEENSKSSIVYKYDVNTKLYMKVDENKGTVAKSGICQASDTGSPLSGEKENQREDVKEPERNLKRTLSTTTTPMTTATEMAITTATATTTKNGEKDETQNEIENTLKECKVQKLDLNNPLNVNSSAEEDGIMYVTVKGSKPNEILLVKVNFINKK